MARYSSIALGKARGSAGNVRFSVWKGIAVAAQKPETVANPRSPKQLSARSRISALVTTFRQIPDFIDAMYGYLAVQKSAYNAWLSSQNKRQFLEFDASDICLGIPNGLLQIANQTNTIGSLSVSPLASSVDVDFAGLSPNRQYTVQIAVQGDVSTFARNNPTIYTSTSGGALDFNVAFSAFGIGTPSAYYILLTDNVTGSKYAYKHVV